jgi:hypothetical protein
MDATENAGSQPSITPAPPVRKRDVTGGVVLIVLGLLFLGKNLLPEFDFSDYWPLILVAVGVSLLLKARHT